MRSALRAFAAVLAALFLLALLALPQLLQRTLLCEGGERYEFYSGRPGSDARITGASAEDAARVRFFLPNVTGESARYADAEDAFAQAERYGAELLFTEYCADVVNYYYYSARLGGGVEVCGRTVNLHVALRGGAACVGSPLIFGGY